MPANQEMVQFGWNHRLPTGFGTKSPQLMALIDLVVQSGSSYGRMVRHVSAFVALGPKTVISNRVTGYRVRNTNTGNGDGLWWPSGIRRSCGPPTERLAIQHLRDVCTVGFFYRRKSTHPSRRTEKHSPATFL